MRFQQGTRGRFTCGGLGALVLSLGLAACGGGTPTGADGTGTDREVASGRKVDTKPVVQPQNTEGRLLASNCFQCHGTGGTGGFDGIRGEDASELLEFLTKTASQDIMAAHAQGYTPEQLQKIIAYLKQ